MAYGRKSTFMRTSNTKVKKYNSEKQIKNNVVKENKTKEKDSAKDKPLLKYIKSTDNIRKIPENQECCCLLYTSPSPRDKRQSRMPSSA